MRTKKWYLRQIKRRPIELARSVVQLAFAFFLLYVGIRFYQFYLHFASLGVEPYIQRPPAVEGFLPISALVALKVWVMTGEFDRIHPAGLIMLTFFIASGFVFRRAFCSWLCPIGTISEWTGKLGKMMFKKNFDLPKWVTWLLTPIKYLLLAFFIKIVVIDMPVMAAKFFLLDSYNKISDVKMMLFFLDISGFSLKVIIVVFLLSLFFKNFWCRFLCPYGALIGLGSLLGISKIKRNEDTCIDCKACTRVCPQRITVSEQKTVYTPECSACMLCVEACPVKDTLNMHVGKKKVNKWVIPVAFFATFAVIVIIAKLTGNWNTVITYQEFKALIPYIDYVGH